MIWQVGKEEVEEVRMSVCKGQPIGWRGWRNI